MTIRVILTFLIFTFLVDSVSAQLFSKRRLATVDEITLLELDYPLDEFLWYISQPIEIEREVKTETKTDIQKLKDKGKLRVRSGKFFEISLFVSNATGLLEYKTDSTIAIRYEEEGKFLVFKLSGEEAYSEEFTEPQYYQLQLLPDRKVAYGGDEWKLISGEYAKLEFKAKGTGKTKASKTKIKGLKKDGTERKGLKLPKIKN